jgi:zinc-ribbon domain
MFCDSCGNQVADSATFCSKCGKPARAAGGSTAQGRVAGHIKVLGILWLAMAGLRLIPGLVLVALGSSRLFPPDVPAFVTAFLPTLGLIFLVGAGISGVIGGGLLARQSWARMLAIIFGGLSLLDIPFGTALGIYTLWVLLPAGSEQEYRATARSV